ncbi:MOSC domain-containing protein [Hymenobacter radiodurans]|uniref:MOSC domain-containing protein n=1 Tax=Hymenobacter radiodurans TaxID=2496028 RepID=UPI001F1168CA|nr:MOSC domain-containing protein [Hymenobacter radiodurans]
MQEATVEARGLRYDRRWLIVNERNQFMTQRQTAEMALLQVAPAHNGFLVTHRTRPDLLPLFVPFDATPERSLFVTIWDDFVFAWRGEVAADQWLSEALGCTCRLVHMSDMAMRPVDPTLNSADAVVSFADAYPFLLIGQGSLDELNSRLADPVPMNQFRPNLVFSGGSAHAEDTWHEFQIGELRFKAVEACGRCVVTTIDQISGRKNPETLRTLASYRTLGGKVMFGQNVTGPGYGQLHIGDALTVVSYK